MATAVASPPTPTKGGLFKRFTTKIRSPTPSPAPSTTSVTPNPPSSSALPNTTSGAPRPPPRKRKTLIPSLPSLPRAQNLQSATALPNAYISSEQRIAALRARGLAPKPPMSEQEREMDLRFSVVVPPPGSRSSAESGREVTDGESEAQRIKDDWLRRNSEESGAAGREERQEAVVVGVHEVEAESSASLYSGEITQQSQQQTCDQALEDSIDVEQLARTVSGLSPEEPRAEDEQHRGGDLNTSVHGAQRLNALDLDPHDVPLPPPTPSSARSTNLQVDVGEDEKVTQLVASTPAPEATHESACAQEEVMSADSGADANQPHASALQTLSIVGASPASGHAETSPPTRTTTSSSSSSFSPTPISQLITRSSSSNTGGTTPQCKPDTLLTLTASLSLPSSPPPDLEDPRSPRALSSLPTLSISPPPLLSVPLAQSQSQSLSASKSTMIIERGRSLEPSFGTDSSFMSGMPTLSPTRSASSYTSTTSEPPHTPITTTSSSTSDPARARKGSGGSSESGNVGLGLKEEVIVESPVEDEARFDFSGVGTAATPLGALVEEEEEEEQDVGQAQAEKTKKKAGLFGRKSANGTKPPSAVRPSRSIGNLRRSVTGSISSKFGFRPKSTLVVDTIIANTNVVLTKPANAVSSPPLSASPVTPAAATGGVIQEAQTPARQALKPTMYSRGSVLVRAEAIEDEESRRLSEAAFLDF